jgi:hypothetical protein
MARLIKLQGLLHFRDSKSETQAEQQNQDRDLEEAREPEREFPPFQRVKQGAGDFFLATGVIPEPQYVN